MHRRRSTQWDGSSGTRLPTAPLPQPAAGINIGTWECGKHPGELESWGGGVARLLWVTVTDLFPNRRPCFPAHHRCAGAAARGEGALPQYLCQTLSPVLVPHRIQRQGTEKLRNQPQPVEEPWATLNPALPVCEELLNTQAALKYQLNHKNH